MANLQQAAQQTAQQIKDALDKIAQAKSNPEQVQQLVNEAKTKLDQFVQQATQDKG